MIVSKTTMNGQYLITMSESDIERMTQVRYGRLEKMSTESILEILLDDVFYNKTILQLRDMFIYL